MPKLRSNLKNINQSSYDLKIVSAYTYQTDWVVASPVDYGKRKTNSKS